MKRRPLLLAALFALCAAAPAFAADDTAPDVFRFEEYSFFEPSDGVLELRGATLVESVVVYSPGEKRDIKFRVASATPTAKQWAEFRRALDDAQVWSWHKTYINRDIIDGGGWRLEIKYPGKHVKSAGQNAEPNTYRRFASAAYKLIDEEKIQWDYDETRMLGADVRAIRLTNCTAPDAIRFLEGRGTELLRDVAGEKAVPLKFIQRFDPAKAPKIADYKREHISFATAFTDVLQMEGLDYELAGKHTIIIKDRAGK